MNLVETFRTDCLNAERIRPEDADDFCRMYADPRVTATLGGVRTHAEARKLLQKNLDHWERHGFGLWVFRDPANGRFVGRAGLRHDTVDGKEEVELAYALMAEFWGNGLATEMARTCLKVGFENLGLGEVVCFTLTTNAASRRVMEKVSFTYERDIVYAGLPHVLYRMKRTVHIV
jgi:RimJ/RimL family protein N-acetyltransferase